MIDYAAEITERVSALDAAERYGFQITRAGFIRCPFHGEKTPSLKVYTGSRGYFCFGCGSGGSVIDFVENLFGLDFREAIKKINFDFDLGLPIESGGRPNLRKYREMQRREEERQRQKAEEERLLKRYHDALDTFAENDKIIMQHKPKSPDDIPDAEFLDALKKSGALSRELDIAEGELRKHEIK